MSYEFKVGYARTNISPMDPVPLSGYGTNSTRISERIMDELYTSCLAFTDAEGNTALVFSWDLQRPQEEIVALVREAVVAATGIPGDKIQLCATHTHSTPDLYDVKNPNIVKYRQLLQDRCAEAAQLALADRKPATFETSGYYASFCDDCWKDNFRHEDGEWLEFSDNFIVSSYSNGHHYENEISVKDEWDRYLKSLGGTY